MTWLEAMERYGVDKPDTRFGMELVELTEVFEATDFKAFAGAEAIKGIRVEGEGDIGRSKLDALTERAKSLGRAGPRVDARARRRRARVARRRSSCPTPSSSASSTRSARRGRPRADRRGERAMAREVLGQLRLDLGRPPVSEGLEFTWIVDFPLFEGLDDAGRPIPAHHAFTAPHPDDLDRLESDPLSVRSRSYDLVLNGWELGRAACESTAPTCSSGSSRCSASTPKTRRTASASCSTRSASARRRTPASRSASTASSRSSPARRTSARSSRSRRPSPA